MKIAARRLPEAKLRPVFELYDRAQEIRGSKELTIVGHSLGGGLAQVVAAIEGEQAVTFNAPGMKDQLGKGPLGRKLDTSRIINFRSLADPVSLGTGKHLGKVKTLKGAGWGWGLIPGVGLGINHMNSVLIKYIKHHKYRDRSPFDLQDQPFDLQDLDC